MNRTIGISPAVVLIVLISFLWACGGGSSGGSSGLPEETSEISYTLPETTKLVTSENESAVLSIEGEGETIVLAADSALAESIEVGDVLMFTITSKTPEGLLRKVVSSSATAAGIELTTEAATMPEAFEQLNLKLVRSLPYGEMSSYDTTLQGLEIRRSPLTLKGETSGKFEAGFDGTVLYDEDGNKNTTDDQVVADGSISFSVGVTLEAKIEWASLKRVKVGAAVSQDGELTIKTTLAGLKLKKEVVLGEMYFAPFMVGLVVVTPKLELILGATGDLKVQVVTSVSEHIGAEAGAVYENGHWTPYSNITSDWDIQPPTLTASAQVKAYVGPRFSLMLYGVAGPHAQVVAYLDLSADVSKTPWWELYAGIEGSLGIEGKILGYELFKFQLEGIVDFRKLLAQAEGPVECEPDCSSLECGLDPVCGESCGTCDHDETCQEGTCVQDGCDPNCSGLECGPDPVCGVSCGTCGAGETCEDGTCVPGECVSDCAGLQCGPDPMCGESCGLCQDWQTCQEGICEETEYPETWLDPVSGLTWQVDPPPNTMLWNQSKNYCENLDLEGGGWHLPSILELRTLIRGCSTTEFKGSCNVSEDDCLASSCWGDSCSGCSEYEGPADGCYWPENMWGPCRDYWSSSADEDEDLTGWFVDFRYSSISHCGGGSFDFGSDKGVRCVR